MIQLPRRSVTRFFIPLIDVLTLLFCIFLLMPVIKGGADGQESGTVGVQGRRSSDEQQAPEGDMRVKEEKERPPGQERKPLEQRLYIRVLDIDPDTGKLFYQESD